MRFPQVSHAGFGAARAVLFACLRRHAGLLALLLSAGSIAALAGAQPAHALCLNPPCPAPSNIADINIGSVNALFDRAAHFTAQIGKQWSPGWNAAAAFNPGGGGADADSGAATHPRYRIWSEGYYSQSRTDPSARYSGDRRESYGGIVGLGASFSSGLSAGVSLDQARTEMQITGQAQTSEIDLTQVAANLSFDSGPWTFSAAGIHGFGRIDASRFDDGGQSTADYGTSLWGVVGEISYHWSRDNWRIVPKGGIDWTAASVDSFAETGGLTRVSATTSDSSRTRVYGTLELGYTGRAGSTVYDIAVYGKAIEIVDQDPGVMFVRPVSPTILPRTVPGVSDSGFEFATGASLSLLATEKIRLYAVYDGRFRDNFQSHAGTAGLEFRW
ncbi:MAG: autotransporter outer membrane beta-barrel domain-containing protein [Xanthobacteraceae bacterium]|nr:autotransporter outer membrane beta-barrel domain-containing protein [Myxococcota bacterium]MCZ7656351.1 autotransporter outer membrane beta-barrel domain-containing protein [Xanthobacteraceae bacterium]